MGLNRRMGSGVTCSVENNDAMEVIDMSTHQTFVIVGGGLAAAKGAEALRANDFDGDVVLIAGEDRLPYERPPLSKEFLAGKQKIADFTTHDADWYRDNKINLRPGTRVESIDRGAKTVTLPDESTVHYDKLLLATGSSSRRPDLAGIDADGVHLLRTYDEAEALSKALESTEHLAIVGAGWIGLEVAASARGRGVEVTVIDPAELPLRTALGPEMGEVFAALHRDHGVDLRLSTSADELVVEGGAVTGVKLSSGETVSADTVLVAVGAAPNVALAEQAGLDLDLGGVAVDSSLRSSDPDIFVVGDIAAAQHPILGERIRVEHWANALNQPAIAALGMLGQDAQYENLPYFFTDQYELGMEYSGYAPTYDKVVVRGDLDTREFVAFWVDSAGSVLAGMQVNIWDALDDVKRLVAAQSAVDLVKLADPDVALGDL